MIQDIAPMRYDNHYAEKEPKGEDYLLVCQKGRIFCRLREGELSFPRVSDLGAEHPGLTYLFEISGERFFLLREGLEALPEGYGWEEASALRLVRPRHLRFAGVTGLQLGGWYESNRFCGRCGKPLFPDHKERMLRCEVCGNLVYPRINPGVIVAITDGDRLLLTKYNRPGMVNYALVAGFTEIGESLEETVQREVMEEVGLKVKNIRFYKSQPWSFTSTILSGFYCEVDGDKSITLDRDELAEAEWFEREKIPVEDDGVSLTREMIGRFKAGKSD